MPIRLFLGFLLIVFALNPVAAQDSLIRKQSGKADSTVHYHYQSVDSLQRNFHHKTDSLQKSYATPMQELHSKINRLNHKKDSLNKLHLPTTSVTHEIDSLQRAQTAKLRELNGQIDKVKKETLAKVSSLHLPPQAQSEINHLTKDIHGFSVPSNFFRLPGMNFKIPGMTGMPSLSLPANLNIPSTNIPSLQKLNLSTTSLPSLAKLEGPLGTEIKQLQSASNLQSLEKTALNDLSQNTEMKSMLKEENQVTTMEGQLSKVKDTKSAEALAQQQLQPAVNHFAGKEKELQSAMGQISKYKQKYSNVKSLAELPKRPPNPLKEKPWIERIVPGLNYFILNKSYVMVDFNPYLGWRFNPNLTASVGFNERVGVSKSSLHTNKFDRVYGMRGSVSYKWKHGFVFKVSPEMMNAYIPAGGTTDDKHQALVYGLFAGVRKDFKIYKNVSGYSEGVYNFIQKAGQNIYGDPLSVRMGIEVQLKKKAKKNGPEKK